MNKALLIGINKYRSHSVPNLSGCENDVKLMKSYLEGNKSPEFDIKTLLSEQATREQVILQIEEHLGNVGEGEMAFLFFSGHGALQTSPPELVAYQQDDQHENIVCYDSCYLNGELLADKELKFLLSTIESKKNADIVVLFDCCHSGSGLRNLFQGNLQKRQIKKLETARAADSFIPGSLDDPTSLPPYRFLAACSPREFSYENELTVKGELVTQGLFTTSLVEVLSRSSGKGKYDYINLMDAVRSKVAWHLDRKAQQTPRLELTGDKSGKVSFLFHGIEHSGQKYLVSWNEKAKRWMVNKGVLQGIRLGSKAKFNITRDNQGNEEVIGMAETSSVGLFESPLHLGENFPQNLLLKTSVYQGKLLYADLHRLDVYDGTGLLDTRKLPSSLPPEGESIEAQGRYAKDLEKRGLVSREEFESQINLTKEAKGTLFSVEMRDEEFYVVWTESGTPLHRDGITLPGNDSSFLQPIAKVLLHLGKFERMKSLSNPLVSSPLKRMDSKIDFWLDEFVSGEGEESAYSHHGPFATIDVSGEEEKCYKTPFRIMAKNGTKKGVSLVYVHFGSNFLILTMQDQEVLGIERSKRLFLKDDKEEENLMICKDREGIFPSHDFDIFKLIVSEEDIPTVDFGVKHSLAKVIRELNGESKGMRSMQTRAIRDPLDEEKAKGWVVKTLNVKILRDLATIGEKKVEVPELSLTIHPHQSFQAQVAIANLASHLTLSDSDRWIRDVASSRGVSLLDFTGRGDSQIELHHMKNVDQIRVDQPLQIEVSGKIPAGYIGVAYTLPASLSDAESSENGPLVKLGNWISTGSNIYQLRVDKIPENPTDYRRDPGKSLKIVTFLEPIV